MMIPHFRIKSSYTKGLFAEYLTLCFLWVRGYKILGHRLKTPLGEVDILAKKGDTLVIVEVKARQHLGPDPLVQPPQQKRLYRAALYLQKRYAKKAFNIRFDVVIVIQGWRLKHYINVWTEGLV